MVVELVDWFCVWGFCGLLGGILWYRLFFGDFVVGFCLGGFLVVFVVCFCFRFGVVGFGVWLFGVLVFWC